MKFIANIFTYTAWPGAIDGVYVGVKVDGEAVDMLRYSDGVTAIPVSKQNLQSILRAMCNLIKEN